jgi:hypothetical protein
MIEKEELFLGTLDDLQNRLSCSDPYETLLIAGLLRKLFLDAHPLADQVNRKYHLRLYFEVGVSPDLWRNVERIDGSWSIQDGLLPEHNPPGLRESHRVTRDQFLATIIIFVDATKFSVRDLIDFGANVAGAVHAGIAKSEKERVLDELGRRTFLGGVSATLRQLRSIGRVVLKGLEPLRIAVAAEG